MVDLSGGADGPLELAFSNSVFILPGIVVVGLSENMAEETEPSGMNLVGAINEKLTETIRNMDVMTVLQKMVATSTEDEESEEIRQKLQGVIAQFNLMSDEDKETFTAKIKEGLAQKISAKLQDSSLDMSGLEDAIGTAVMNQLYIAGAVIFVILVLVVFFGYKLYKSIKDKELKKEEKKKAKQLKKKK